MRTPSSPPLPAWKSSAQGSHFFNDFPSDLFLAHRELAMAEPAMENGEAPRKKVRRGDPQFNQLRTQKRQKENPEVKSSQSSALLLFCCPTGVTLLGLS